MAYLQSWYYIESIVRALMFTMASILLRSIFSRVEVFNSWPRRKKVITLLHSIYSLLAMLHTDKYLNRLIVGIIGSVGPSSVERLAMVAIVAIHSYCQSVV